MPKEPVSGKISHKFGEDRRTRRHNGVDYPVSKGTPVEASADGLVVRSTYHEPREKIFTFRTDDKVRTEKKFTGSYGNVIIIYHGQDIWSQKHTYTLYAHLDDRSASKYEYVKEGQVIGTVGNSGTKQGFYNKKGGFELHFEVIQSYKKLDWVRTGPLDFRCTSETWRTDPERFLSRTSKGYAIEYKGKYTVNLSDGTVITSDGLIVSHRDSNDKVLKTAMRGDRPHSGFWGRALKALNALNLDFGFDVENRHPNYPASAQDFSTKEELDAWKRK